MHKTSAQNEELTSARNMEIRVGSVDRSNGLANAGLREKSKLVLGQFAAMASDGVSRVEIDGNPRVAAYLIRESGLLVSTSLILIDLGTATHLGTAR